MACGHAIGYDHGKMPARTGKRAIWARVTLESGEKTFAGEYVDH